MDLQELQRYGEITANFVLIPDDILVRDGIACGDSLIVQASVDQGILDFVFCCEACLQCKAIMGYLYSKYNHSPLSSALRGLKLECQIADERFEDFCFQVFKERNLRKECIIRPMEICLHFFEQLNKTAFVPSPLKETKSDLDCDACVSTGRVSWNRAINEPTLHEENKDKKSSRYIKAVRTKWMPLSKAYLNKKEIQLLRTLVDKISYEDVRLFAAMKIDQMLFFNIKKYCKESYWKNPIWKSVFYREYRNTIVKNEIEMLRQFILDSQLPAYFVKGSFTQKLYTKDTGIRLFLDYDILATSSEAAFLIATFLFRHQFKIFYSEFSIKHIQSDQGVDVYTGHFHLQKYIYGQYQIIIDINFPGFPMGRISLYYPKRIVGRSISNEDEFVITLCHLFKHKDVFMKDLNDLYLLLKTDLDFQYLSNRIQENRLDLFFSIATNFIINNYDLDEEVVKKILAINSIGEIIMGEWPYDYNQVYLFKRADLNTRNEAYLDNDRIYLFPLAVFSCCPKISNDMKNKLVAHFDKLVQYDDSLYSICQDGNNYLLCGMGVFWDHSNKLDGVTRKDVEIIVNDIIAILQMKDNIIFLPYYLHRHGDWF